MGDPRKQRKKFETPRFPWRTDILEDELSLLGQYGLRNKRELWRYKTMLSKFRGIARSLVGKTSEERMSMEEALLSRMRRLGIVSETAVLDDILDSTVQDILERRLQTIVLRKNLAKSVYQARQLITHGHISIGKQKVTVPGYLVTTQDEGKIAYTPRSPFTNPNHPIRQEMAASPALGGDSQETPQPEA